MTLEKIKKNLKFAYYLNEAKQIVVVYLFALLSIMALGFLIYTYIDNPTQVENQVQKLINNSNKNETLYTWLFFGGIMLLLVFYIVYAVFFYPKKFKRAINDINNFVLELQNGNKITDYSTYPIAKTEITFLHTLYGWQLADFEISKKKNYPSEAGDFFIISEKTLQALMEYYDSYGNDKNIEQTWNQLK